jgi:DNA polymerase-3 subunit alpha (Gram-positive type)
LRSKQYDYDWMLKPGDEIAKQLEAYKRLKNESRKKLSPKDADLEVMLANLLEMKERGFAFLPLDLQRSDATQFIIDEDRQGIIPPFIVLDGVGEAAAKSVIQARIERPFASIDDVKNRTKLSKTNIEAMRLRDVFVQLQHDEVTSLFSFTD